MLHFTSEKDHTVANKLQERIFDKPFYLSVIDRMTGQKG